MVNQPTRRLLVTPSTLLRKLRTKTKACKQEFLDCLPKCTKKMIEGDKETDDGTFRVAPKSDIKAFAKALGMAAGDAARVGALHENSVILIPEEAFVGAWPAYKYKLGRLLIHEYQHVKNFTAGIGLAGNVLKKNPYAVFRCYTKRANDTDSDGNGSNGDPGDYDYDEDLTAQRLVAAFGHWDEVSAGCATVPWLQTAGGGDARLAKVEARYLATNLDKLCNRLNQIQPASLEDGDADGDATAAEEDNTENGQIEKELSEYKKQLYHALEKCREKGKACLNAYNEGAAQADQVAVPASCNK